MNRRLNGIKIALCQMKVFPGRPDLNVAYIVEEIKEAIKRKVDIILFPEMCTTGYFIGDLWEDEAFLADVEYLNRDIREATKDGIVAVIGTPVCPVNQQGEDGRLRVLNAAVVYANGRYIGHTVKTLQPNYRMFDDDRHFFSSRKIALEEKRKPESVIKPFTLNLKNGMKIRLGVTLCEDMWNEFYSLNPIEILAKKHADIICNLSASPWTWQKNRKRHGIIKRLAEACKIPVVYVNNVGIQNTGKNIIVFDGCSAVYDDYGQIIYEVSPYAVGTHDIVLKENAVSIPETAQDDTKELYQAVRCGIKEFFASLPVGKRKIVIGLSGGIDSSLSAALYADILGAQNVIGINMPSKFNSDKTRSLAAALAENLGITYEVRPIQEIVDAIAVSCDVKEDSLSYENIQARSRMEILAGRTQELSRVFSANWNKIEAAFGYGTLYGDMAGALAILGDLVKREIYQLAEYMNREIFKREIIPNECFTIPPTAELRSNQRDPFDYGNLTKRGYHEEMVRAFIEFRRNPEWFIELYAKGLLEGEMKLNDGRLKEIFPTSRHFIHDLEKYWRAFSKAYFKRIQGPPILIISKRAFGTDLRESLMPAHFTNRYFDLKAHLLSREHPRLAIYGGSFNPPGLHHLEIVLSLLEWFNEVVIIPCGPRSEKDSLNDVPLNHRREMAMLNFSDLSPRVILDMHDLENNVFTPTYAVDERYKKLYSEKEIWHVAGGDLVIGGNSGNSEIQHLWKKGGEIWHILNFAIVTRPGFYLAPYDLPPFSEVIEIENIAGSSTLIRDAISKGQDVQNLLKKEVYEYIKKSGLYQKNLAIEE